MPSGAERNVLFDVCLPSIGHPPKDDPALLQSYMYGQRSNFHLAILWLTPATAKSLQYCVIREF